MADAVAFHGAIVPPVVSVVLLLAAGLGFCVGLLVGLCCGRMFFRAQEPRKESLDLQPSEVTPPPQADPAGGVVRRRRLPRHSGNTIRTFFVNKGKSHISRDCQYLRERALTCIDIDADWCCGTFHVIWL